MIYLFLYMQKETNGVVTMKIIPNQQSRSKTCEVISQQAQDALSFAHVVFVFWCEGFCVLVCMCKPRRSALNHLYPSVV